MQTVQEVTDSSRDKCLQLDVTRKISNICHGHNSCIISPNVTNIENTDGECSFLNVTYTCMHSECFNSEFIKYLVENNIPAIKNRTIEERNENLTNNNDENDHMPNLCPFLPPQENFFGLQA